MTNTGNRGSFNINNTKGIITSTIVSCKLITCRVDSSNVILYNSPIDEGTDNCLIGRTRNKRHAHRLPRTTIHTVMQSDTSYTSIISNRTTNGYTIYVLRVVRRMINRCNTRVFFINSIPPKIICISTIAIIHSQIISATRRYSIINVFIISYTCATC